jgi:FkbM family methyltransferase
VKALKTIAHELLRRAGVDVVRYPQAAYPELRRTEIMRNLDIEFVADVGANAGQYVDAIRANGYTGRIVAFEPQSHAYELLARKPGLTAHRVAIGSKPGETTISISGNSQSSSLRPMHDTHLQAAPESAYILQERVQLRTLDSFALDADWVKIDTQGFEREVISGGRETLERTRGVEVELSYLTLYEGQALAPEIQATLEGLGFRLASYGWAFIDPATDVLLAVDAIYIRA